MDTYTKAYLFFDHLLVTGLYERNADKTGMSKSFRELVREVEEAQIAQPLFSFERERTVL